MTGLINNPGEVVRVNTPVIGIKIANGTFFPILNVDDSIKKRVILTPVATGQKDVKIDIYRGEGDGMLNPVYVASLILNNIQENGDNGSEVELLININEENILDAEAQDRVSGEKQFLSISLDSIDEADFFDVPDGDEDSFLSAEIDDEFDSLDAEERDDTSGYDEDEDFQEESGSRQEMNYLYDYKDEKPDRKTTALKIAVVFLSVIFILFVALLVYTLVKKPALSKSESSSSQGIEVVVEDEVAKAVPEKQETVNTALPPADDNKTPPVPAEPVKKPVPEVKKTYYRIKRGDTLWDISYAYYRTPWLYKKIAKDNNIKNPDLIFAGSRLEIRE